MIKGFSGEYRWLSNFEKPLCVNGIGFASNEHWFNFNKTLDKQERMAIWQAETPGQAKRLGRKATLRPDWEQIKEEVMMTGLRAKFTNQFLAQALVDTYPQELVESNTWHDNYWGDCTCNKCKDKPGKNRLGELLMDLRQELM